MARVFRSMSGEPMVLTDADRVICIIMGLPARTMRDIKGRAIIGCESAIEIRDALREEGFEIVRTHGQQVKGTGND